MLTFINPTAFPVLAASSMRRRKMKGMSETTSFRDFSRRCPCKCICKSAKDFGIVFCNGTQFSLKLFIPVIALLFCQCSDFWHRVKSHNFIITKLKVIIKRRCQKKNLLFRRLFWCINPLWLAFSFPWLWWDESTLYFKKCQSLFNLLITMSAWPTCQKASVLFSNRGSDVFV